MPPRAIKGSPWRDLYVRLLNKSTIVTGFIVLAGLQSAVRAETYTGTGNGDQADNLVPGSEVATAYSFTDQVQTFSSVSPPPNATFKRTE